METLGTDYDRDTTGWRISFGNFRDGKWADDFLDLYPGDYRRDEKFGDTTYTVDANRVFSDLPDSTAAKFIDSPEGMREFGLTLVKTVRTNAVAAIKAGLGPHLYARRPNRHPRISSGRFPEPNIPYEDSDRPMTADETAIAVKHVDEEMDRRERLLVTNFREMHAALLEAFPWKDCLKAKTTR